MRSSDKFERLEVNGKTNERNGRKIEFIKKDDNEKPIKQQSNSTFNRILKSFTNYVSFTFKQIEVSMYKPIYLY